MPMKARVTRSIGTLMYPPEWNKGERPVYSSGSLPWQIGTLQRIPRHSHGFFSALFRSATAHCREGSRSGTNDSIRVGSLILLPVSHRLGIVCQVILVDCPEGRKWG